MTDLMERDIRVADAARALHAKPIEWGQLNMAYETIKGLMSPKKTKKDWRNLVSIGWVSEDDSRRFFDTAGYYRHGHPRGPIKHASPMSLDEAESFLKELFRQLVDHLQPK